MQHEAPPAPGAAGNVALVEDALLLDRAGLWTDVFRGTEEERRRLQEELTEAKRRGLVGEQRWATQCQALRVQLTTTQQQVRQAAKGQAELLGLRKDISALSQVLVEAQEARSTLVEANAALARDLSAAQEELRAQCERYADLENDMLLLREEQNVLLKAPPPPHVKESPSSGIFVAVQDPESLTAIPSNSADSERLVGEVLSARQQLGEAEERLAELRAELRAVAAAQQTAVDDWHTAVAMREVLQRENEGLRAQLLGCQHQQAEECSALVAQLAALQAEHTATQHALAAARAEAEEAREQWLEAERRATQMQEEVQRLWAMVSAEREEVEQLKAEGRDAQATLQQEVDAAATLRGRHAALAVQAEATAQAHSQTEARAGQLEALVHQLRARLAQAEQLAAEDADSRPGKLTSLQQEAIEARAAHQEALEQLARTEAALQSSEAQRADLRSMQEQCLEELRQRLSQEAARHDREERLLRSQVVELTAQREVLRVEAVQAQARADQCVALAAQRAEQVVEGEREAQRAGEAQHRARQAAGEAALRAADERCAALHAALEAQAGEVRQLREEKAAEQNRADEMLATLEAEAARWDRERNRLLTRLREWKDWERQLAEKQEAALGEKQQDLDSLRRQYELQVEAQTTAFKQAAEKHRRRLSEAMSEHRRAEAEAEAAQHRRDAQHREELAVVRGEAAAACAALEREKAGLARELEITTAELHQLKSQAVELAQVEVQQARFEVRPSHSPALQENESLQRELAAWKAAFADLEAKLHEGVAERRQREAEHGALLAGVAEGRRREAEGHEAAVQQLRAVTAEHARATRDVAAAWDALARAQQGWEAERTRMTTHYEELQSRAARELEEVRAALQAQRAAWRALPATPPGEAAAAHVPALRLQAETLATAVAALSDVVPAIGRGLRALRQQDGAVAQLVQDMLGGAKAAQAAHVAAVAELDAERRRWKDQLQVLRMENTSLKSLLESAQMAAEYARQRDLSSLIHSTPHRQSTHFSASSEPRRASAAWQTPKHTAAWPPTDRDGDRGSPAGPPPFPLLLASPHPDRQDNCTPPSSRPPPRDGRLSPASATRSATPPAAIRSSSSSSRPDSYASQRLAAIQHAKRSSSARPTHHQRRPL